MRRLHLLHIAAAACLALALPACQPTEVLSSHNLLAGEILTVAHGGGGFETYRNTTPANTTAATQRSLYQSADAVEIDIQLSADDVPVVFHDGRLEEKTTCTGCIGTQTAEALRDCRYKTRNGSLDGDFRLPTLDSMFTMVKAANSSAQIFLNTKHDSPCDSGAAGHTRFAEALVACIRRHDMSERVLIESLDAQFLLAVRAVAPDLRLLFDDEEFTRGMNVVRAHDFLGLAISNAQVTEAQVREAHAEGYWLGIWGVKLLGDTRKAVQKGPEFVMTDDLLMLQSTLKR